MTELVFPIFCPKCDKMIDDEEIISRIEDRGKYKGREEIITGYKCNNCGYKKKF